MDDVLIYGTVKFRCASRRQSALSLCRSLSKEERLLIKSRTRCASNGFKSSARVVSVSTYRKKGKGRGRVMGRDLQWENKEGIIGTGAKAAEYEGGGSAGTREDGKK